MSEDRKFQPAQVEQILRREWVDGTGVDYYELVFTTTRLIIANLGGQQDLTGLGAAFSAIGRSAAKKTELQTLSPDAIYADNPRNISIRYTDITSITIKRPGFLGIGGLMVWRGNYESHNFRFSMKKKELQDFIDFLQSILKEKIIIK